MTTEPVADIAVIGLAVMGQNLILNMNDHGFTVVAYNRTVEKVDQFLAHEARGTNIRGARSIEEMVAQLKRPRRVMLMVKAGRPVDEFIDLVLPHLEPGDILIDGGNSLFEDTIRRTQYVESKGLLYIGTGVSGGEEGARRGPSIMPGGSPAAWEHVRPIFQSIAAKVDGEVPCCDWVGENGAGHYVKMVHNGIEYGDMQLICEAYQLMKDGLGMDADEMHRVFAEWYHGDLNSYLIEITRDILGFKDEDGLPMVDKILDTAGQKGTGKWTVISSQELGIPVTLIAEAVYARCVSAMKDERVKASKKLKGPKPLLPLAADPVKKAKFIEDIRQALYAAKIVSYAQGYMLMRAAADQYQWKLNYGGVALMWRGGCIIRSVFLGRIKEAFDRNKRLANLMLDPFFKQAIRGAQKSWRNVVATAVKKGIPVPAFSTALAFYDGFRSERLPANLLQAQRDYFGAHTYERVDKPRGEFFHTNWTGRGGTTASSTYTV
ncbi:MAG: decarboxylating NADP(+)-dependent phosphogluconate dehydrogenase [Verrucomicrobiales bacterium]|nr:decarboxylating NADP(+)-dependent phosphogluconate dehydrogenase [Verrucomicrobiales bacterium]MCP5526761.1 decarboxylating NADP(+)-dependent phosphogluconate dehydrogenase [Verrucomicrobiales bacterium]